MTKYKIIRKNEMEKIYKKFYKKEIRHIRQLGSGVVSWRCGCVGFLVLVWFAVLVL